MFGFPAEKAIGIVYVAATWIGIAFAVFVGLRCLRGANKPPTKPEAE
jgi:hypothetical protein